jgi:hypothetical protein
MVAATGLCLVLMPGCGNPVDTMLADEALRTQLMEKVTGSPELSGQMVDRLLGADSTRAALLERVMAGGGSRQAVLMKVATDRSMMEGAIHFAMQDTAMRASLMTLFRGMQMAGTP